MPTEQLPHDRPRRTRPGQPPHAYLPPKVAAPPGAERVSFVLLDRWDERLDRFQQRCDAAGEVRDLAQPARPGTSGAIGMALVDREAEVLAAAWLVPQQGGAGRLALVVRDDYRFRGLGGSLLDIGVRHARLLAVPCVHGDVSGDRVKALSLLRSRGSVRPVPGSVHHTVCLRLDPEYDCQLAAGHERRVTPHRRPALRRATTWPSVRRPSQVSG